ncbi:MAG: hypothetical protein FWG85_07755, partial [Bacteroidetes bacterium]|nr:hypothetical protein [Bacteroidota bacterium]
MQLITIGDITDTYIKIKQKGFNSMLSKIRFNKNRRIESKWNEKQSIGGFWHIPFFMQHWNKVITGDANINY